VQATNFFYTATVMKCSIGEEKSVRGRIIVYFMNEKNTNLNWQDSISMYRYQYRIILMKATIVVTVYVLVIAIIKRPLHCSVTISGSMSSLFINEQEQN